MSGFSTYMALSRSNTPPDAFLKAISDADLAELIRHLEETNATAGLPGMVLVIAQLEAARRFVLMMKGGVDA